MLSRLSNIVRGNSSATEELPMYLPPTTEEQKEPIVADAAPAQNTGPSSYMQFGSMMSNVCTSIGSRFKTMQVPSVSIPAIFKYST